MPVLIVEPLTLELMINNAGLGVIDYNLCATTCSGIFYNDARTECLMAACGYQIRKNANRYLCRQPRCRTVTLP